MTAIQAEDEGLWFLAQTAPEAYLQQELRRLTACVERHALLALALMDEADYAAPLRHHRLIPDPPLPGEGRDTKEAL